MASWTPWTVGVEVPLIESLIITFMFEPAKLQMNCASASGARIAPSPLVASRWSHRFGPR